jgi:N-acetylglucosamine kinase-like BadF-type ATPase
MKMIIGIDAGGTKTKGLLLDDNKNILQEEISGHGNPTVSFPDALKNIGNVIQHLTMDQASSSIDSIIIGMAGAESGNLASEMKKELEKLTSLPIYIINDAALAYFSLIGNNNGVLTISGTGSISYGRNGALEGMTGGWGHLLGDEGSAYHVAIQSIKRIADEIDQGAPLSYLSSNLLKKISATDGKGLKGFIYSSSKGEIASLTEVIHQLAEGGNQTAISLFQDAGTALGHQTVQLLQRLNIVDTPIVAWKGSVLEKNQWVQEAFKKVIDAAFNGASYCSHSLSPATGAIEVQYAIKKGMIQG